MVTRASFRWTRRRPRASGGRRGFTLIELLVVMAIIATLLTIAVPRYLASVERSREAVLRENLNVMRDAIDKFHGDRGVYPSTLQDLVTQRYLRNVPIDPVTEAADTWVALPPPGAAVGGVYDVKSGAQGKSAGGLAYSEL